MEIEGSAVVMKNQICGTGGDDKAKARSDPMKTRGDPRQTKRRTYFEGTCSRAGFANAANLEVYNVQDETS